MIRFLYILAKHGINPFSKFDDIAISKMRYRLSMKEKYQLLKYAKSDELKQLLKKYLFWGVNHVYFKIATTIWLTLIAFGMTSAALNKKVTVSTRLLGIAVMFGQILAIAFMWQ